MGAIWLGVDDTDHPRGGCTTWILTELVRVARSEGLDLIGEPRLVRLNPNVPWKTRGNAALAARFGHGTGDARTIGSVDRRPVAAYPRGAGLDRTEADALFGAAWDRIDRLSARVPGTDPALVGADRPLPPSLYWNAVRAVVDVDRTVAELDVRGVRYRSRGGRRGLVGASAAIAWPGRRATWELIAYRPADRWGTPRAVDADSVARASTDEPDLFLCHDARTRRLLVAPHSPCPILYGLRGTTPEAPLRDRPSIRAEPVDRWLLFRTNQATGDHLIPRIAAEVRPYLSAIVDGTVDRRPAVRPGGHVGLTIRDDRGGRLPCVAFEPTKTLPSVARSLRPGDRVRLWGGRGRTGAFRLEGIRIVRLAERASVTKPTCERCGRGARSLGRARGFRCPACGRRWPPEAARRAPLPPEFPVGEYHPTPSARRHLAPRPTPGVAVHESF